MVQSDKQGLVFLYFGNIAWARMKQRTQHLAEGLAQHNRLVYVDPFADPIFWNSRRRSQRPGKKPRLGYAHISGNLTEFDSLGLPWSSRSLRIRDLQYRLAGRFLYDGMVAKKEKPDVIWLSHPGQREVLSIHPFDVTVCYDCMDDWSLIERPGDVSGYRRREEDILRLADVVFASSKALELRCRKYAKNVFRVENGVDAKIFRYRRSDSEFPVIGFFGNIGNWLNLDWIKQAAISRPHWRFRLVGPWLDKSAKERMSRLPNLEILGEVPYESIPTLAESFDVCIMPFVTEGIGPTINPVKMFEYLATGKPIVSTAIAEAERLKPLIRIADTVAEFIAQIDEALKERDQDMIVRRLAAARDNDWQMRVDRIEEEIKVSRQTRKSPQPAAYTT